MKNKFVLSLLSTIFTFGIFNNTAFASNLESTAVTPDAIKNIVDQSKSLELIDVNDLPEGTIFIDFDSIEDFEKAVTNLNNEASDFSNENKHLNLMHELPLEEFQTMAASSTTSVLTVFVKPSLNPIKGAIQPPQH